MPAGPALAAVLETARPGRAARGGHRRLDARGVPGPQPRRLAAAAHHPGSLLRPGRHHGPRRSRRVRPEDRRRVAGLVHHDGRHPPRPRRRGPRAHARPRRGHATRDARAGQGRRVRDRPRRAHRRPGPRGRRPVLLGEAPELELAELRDRILDAAYAVDQVWAANRLAAATARARVSTETAPSGAVNVCGRDLPPDLAQAREAPPAGAGAGRAGPAAGGRAQGRAGVHRGPGVRAAHGRHPGRRRRRRRHRRGHRRTQRPRHDRTPDDPDDDGDREDDGTGGPGRRRSRRRGARRRRPSDGRRQRPDDSGPDDGGGPGPGPGGGPGGGPGPDHGDPAGPADSTRSRTRSGLARAARRGRLGGVRPRDRGPPRALHPARARRPPRRPARPRPGSRRGRPHRRPRPRRRHLAAARPRRGRPPPAPAHPASPTRRPPRPPTSPPDRAAHCPGGAAPRPGPASDAARTAPTPRRWPVCACRLLDGATTAWLQRAREALARSENADPDDHPATTTRERDRRFPGRRLAAWVTARDQTCTAPSCTRPAEACDLDHTLDWLHGGLTEAGDLEALCRHDHRAKHEGGWTYEQPTPGRFVITDPTGTRHHTESRVVHPRPTSVTPGHAIAPDPPPPPTYQDWRPRRTRDGRITHEARTTAEHSPDANDNSTTNHPAATTTTPTSEAGLLSGAAPGRSGSAARGSGTRRAARGRGCRPPPGRPPRG